MDGHREERSLIAMPGVGRRGGGEGGGSGDENVFFTSFLARLFLCGEEKENVIYGRPGSSKEAAMNGSTLGGDFSLWKAEKRLFQYS
ncbi:Hypothetical protein NTJ_03179 [Nesidiocoris tenuis]|uniref:Uncharacterized protein n=1 Tax=Nesidiocoris tenuis TaxID=355587 RepID=A0ABN7ADJ5_9HEMI|nr:Hypothetical protein NTJ_03179 [Nesidiocoris tenuis]